MKVKIGNYIVPNDDKEVYDYFGIDATCPKDIQTAIDESDSEEIEVEIGTCYGGDVWSGSEIYTALKNYKGEVKITITALAASAASIIAMAGNCEMSPTSQIFVHNASSVAWGDYHDMNKASDRLQTVNKALANAYMLKSGMSEEKALEMMDEETWLTAAKAKELGLIDEIMFSGEKGQLVAAYGELLPREVIEKTKNVLHSPPTSDDSIEIEKAKLTLQLTL